MDMHIRKPSASVVIASLALFFALGGSAVAAHHFLITKTSQIKPSVRHALRGNEGPEGAQGQTGPAGPAGPSVLSGLIIVPGPHSEVPNESSGTSVATCPAGAHAVSGGGYAGAAGIAVSEMSPDHQSWIVLVLNFSGITTNLEAIAYCAGAGQAVAAGTPRAAHARAVNEAHTLAGKLDAERRAKAK
jgi:hypothetical protein